MFLAFVGASSFSQRVYCPIISNTMLGGCYVVVKAKPNYFQLG